MTTTERAPLPDWLRDHLVAAGHMTRDGVTRSARIHPCPRCRRATLAGFDGDLASGVARCEPHPLTATGELVALLADPPRATYGLWRVGDRLELWYRGQDAIAGHPAGCDGIRCDVLAEHRCDEPIPAALVRDEWATSPATPPVADDTDRPPF